MDEKLERFLEAPSVAWDNVYRTSSKPIGVSVFIDAIGGKWDLKNFIAPCGGPLESRSNAYRLYWYCPLHESEGTLINLFKDNSFCWLPPVKEVKR